MVKNFYYVKGTSTNWKHCKVEKQGQLLYLGLNQTAMKDQSSQNH